MGAEYQIRYVDAQHRDFLQAQILAAQEAGVPVDCYFKSLFYLLGLCSETRIHYKEVFDFRERGIIPEALTTGWQTGTSSKVTCLAFNLWNGLGAGEEHKADYYQFLPDNLFCCQYMEYFFDAIRLRFPEYCDQKLCL